MASERNYNVFISYAHQDAKWKDDFLKHLAPAKRRGLVDVWTDDVIQASQNWREEIEKALDTADVGLLLVSANFLASDFIMESELPAFVRAQQAGRCRIVWVLLQECGWRFVEELEVLQAAHSPARPLRSLRAADRDKELTRIIQELLDVAPQPAASEKTHARSSAAPRSLNSYYDAQARQVLLTLRASIDDNRPGVAVLGPFGFPSKEVVNRVLEEIDDSLIPIALQPDWRTENDDALYRKLHRDLQWGAPSRLGDFPAESAAWSWKEKFQRSVEELVEVARGNGQRLLLAATQLERVRREVLEAWSAMLSELGQRGLSLLAPGGRELHELRRRAVNGASAFHELVEVRLGPLERSQIAALFAEAAEAVWSETGGHPRLIAELLPRDSALLADRERVRTVLRRGDCLARLSALVESDPALKERRPILRKGISELEDRLVWLGVLREVSESLCDWTAPVFQEWWEERK